MNNQRELFLGALLLVLTVGVGCNNQLLIAVHKIPDVGKYDLQVNSRLGEVALDRIQTLRRIQSALQETQLGLDRVETRLAVELEAVVPADRVSERRDQPGVYRLMPAESDAAPQLDLFPDLRERLAELHLQAEIRLIALEDLFGRESPRGPRDSALAAYSTRNFDVAITATEVRWAVLSADTFISRYGAEATDLIDVLEANTTRSAISLRLQQLARSNAATLSAIEQRINATLDDRTSLLVAPLRRSASAGERSSYERIAALGFGGFQSTDVFEINPSDPKYAEILDYKPYRNILDKNELRAEPLTAVKVGAQGDSVIMIVVEGPNQVRWYQIQNNARQVVDNIALVVAKGAVAVSRFLAAGGTPASALP